MTRLAEDLPLFAALADAPTAAAAQPSAVEETLAAVDADELTPREALDLIYRLRSLLDD